jgi:hypothetical protein
MNEMNELMIHVERIVRPVSAAQGRKLRMRTELLAHLQAALEEDRARFPNDEPAAIEQAKQRLGEPAQLTRQLQQTVPMTERLLLARLPVGRRFENWDRKSARRLYGNCGPMTFGHISMLSGTAILTGVPFLMSVLSAVKTSGPQPIFNPFLCLGGLVGWPLLLVASYRFVFGAATSDHRVNGPATLQRGAAVLGLQIALMFLVAWLIAHRSATAREFVTCVVSTLMFLAVSILVARCVAILRRPYDPWLTLSIER